MTGAIGKGFAGDPMPSARVGARVGALRGFPPVIDRGSRLLILGSFPGVASLRCGNYYAHPSNQFWPILGEILGEPLAQMDFEARYRRLLGHRVALWDVLHACRRNGSLDADIRDAAANDFERLASLGPKLEAVLFNGRTAARSEPMLRARGLRTTVLPSTSAAHARMRFEQKLASWRAAFAQAAIGVDAAAGSS